MVMRDIDSFHCPEPMFISLGCASGNKPGLGEMKTAYIPHNQTLNILLYRYDTIMPVYLHHVNRKSDHTVSRLGHGSSHIFEEILS